MPNKKKLAIFINALNHGGGQKIASVLLKELQNEFIIYFVILEKKLDYPIPEGINITVLKKYGNRFFHKIAYPYSYYQFCKKNNIDVSLSLLTQCNYISALTKLLGTKTKIILSEHTYQSLWRSNEWLYSKFKKIILFLLYNRADKIVTVSNKIREDLSSNFRINKKKIVTIFNPYQIEKINTLSKERVDILEFENIFTIITVGTLYHVKNHELLIRSFAKLKEKNIQLVIVGDGELRKELEALREELNLSNKVHFIGFTDNPFKYVGKSDLFVLTSNNEGLPNVLIEAEASCCPIISTDCISGPREILAPSTSINFQLRDSIEYCEYGILVPIKNEKLLTEAMERVINDRNLLLKYKKKSSQRAHDFKAEKSIRNYIETISKV